jgi:hypothetical protein
MSEAGDGATEQPASSEPVLVHLRLSVSVADPEALRDYARRRYAACWFDEEWAPGDLAEAVLEALVLSNENPSPADYGIEILESQASEVPAGAGEPRPLLRARKGGGKAK